MADIIRYTNPLSTGGNGTTTDLTGANAAYASLNAALVGEAADLVTATSALRIKCFGNAEDTVAVVVPTGYTANSTYPIIVENATGESGGDPSLTAWDATAWRHNPTITSGKYFTFQ